MVWRSGDVTMPEPIPLSVEVNPAFHEGMHTSKVLRTYNPYGVGNKYCIS